MKALENKLGQSQQFEALPKEVQNQVLALHITGSTIGLDKARTVVHIFNTILPFSLYYIV